MTRLGAGASRSLALLSLAAIACPGGGGPVGAGTRDALHRAFEATDRARAILATDTVDGVADAALRARGALEEATAALPEDAPPAAGAAIREATGQAAALASASDLPSARRALGGLTRSLAALATLDPTLAEGWTVHRCPMAEGYAVWFEAPGPIENPYMGASMLSCAVPASWQEAASAPLPAGAATGPAPPPAHRPAGAVAYYTCPMHPSVRATVPGQCPICGMDLTPVTHDELESGVVLIDDARRRRIGLTVEAARVLPVTVHVRALGQVRPDQTRLHDVSLRASGWVQRLLVDTEGAPVRAGQTLLTLYSPEIHAAEQEHLAMVRRRAAGVEGLVALARASRRKLRLLGLSDAHIEALERRGDVSEEVPIAAPARGYVLEKHVVEGSRIDAGAVVYRIADLSKVWVEAEVYEGDLPHVRAGQDVTVTLPFVPGRAWSGKVDYLYPTLDAASRTARLRVVLDNPDLALKPGMYAEAMIEVELGERLTVPESAVLFTGTRRIVFVDLGADRLRPQEVELGAHAGDRYEVRAGLSAGDVVVTSANFLVAAESRLRSAVGPIHGAHEAHGPPQDPGSGASEHGSEHGGH